eukprot:2736447-Pyramimonas_sp.AAC.1
MGLFVHIGHGAHNAEAFTEVMGVMGGLWCLKGSWSSLESSALGGYWAHRARNAPGGHRAHGPNRARKPRRAHRADRGERASRGHRAHRRYTAHWARRAQKGGLMGPARLRGS